MSTDIKISENDKNMEMIDNFDSNDVNIYRYNFNEIVMDELSTFAKLHQYDQRKDYKEAWKLWVDENNEIIKKEEERLNKLGYEGDIIDKMYKAARYYFRKKPQVKNEPKQRRKYISMEQDIISSMDEHIYRNIVTDDYSPSSGYSEFCKLNIELIKSEIKRMLDIGITSEDISVKIKKTYKNRYFIISRNNMKESKITKKSDNPEDQEED
jgi:hypothetical protein